MTLFKQMAIAVSLIIVILLSAVMAINYQSAKKDMIQSLYETTVNNISTLANKLAEAGGVEEEGDEESDEDAQEEETQSSEDSSENESEEVAIEDEESQEDEGSDNAELFSTIDSEFDSGYYKMIDFQSSDGKSDYKQLDSSFPEGIPTWFIEFTDVQLKSVSADVSSGWSIIGSVTVLGDTGVVYKALYEMFINLSYLFVLSLVLSLLVLNMMLHFILKPLYRVQNQAEAILKNEFVIQSKIPFTTEFKDVVKGMNAMVSKVEDIFEKGNEAVQRNKELLYNDPVTKLFNRRYLMLKLPDLIKMENKTDGGTVLFVALSSLEALNQAVGGQKADETLVELSAGFNKICKKYDERVVSRVNGTEFTLMLPDCEADIGSDIARRINRVFKKLVKANDLDTEIIYINIGIYRYKPTSTVGELLTRADNALSVAQAKEDDNTYLYEEKDDENALGKEQWRAILEESIEKNHFSLRFWPTINAETKELSHKVMTFTIQNDDKRYFYGDFIAPAINLGLASKMYLVMLNNLLRNSHEEIEGTTCSIRMSNEFIKDKYAFDELSKLFATYAKELKFKLDFEVSDSFAIKNITAVKQFVDLFAKYEFGFAINSFTGESTDFTYLKTLNPEYLKADTAFLLDQSQDSMSALQVITDSLGIDIVATFVKDEEELEKLQALHVDIVQGPVTDSILL